jgi:peptidyl-prolyl cis-trans isomerase D
MLSFFRRLINSKLGIIITMGVLVVIALAFALGDVTGLRGTGQRGATGDTVATVGKTDIAMPDLKRRVQSEMEGYRQEQPTLDMAQFVAGGGVEGTLTRYINNIAFQHFGEAHGMVVSKRSIDGQIASIPQLKGPNGQFDDKIFARLLAAQGMTAESFRDDVARVTIAQQLTAPTLGASEVPGKLALPYASLLLEKRTGTIGFIPTAAMGLGTVPSDSDINAYYARNVSRYVIPQRRVIRYAIVSADAVKAQTKPTDADVAAAYKAQASKYAARETRSVSQVVLADKASADALVAKVKAGAPIDAAARAAGLEAARLTGLEKAGYASQTSADIANAAFAAARGTVIGPFKGPLGWIVAQIDAIDHIAAKSIDQARPELIKQLGDQKSAEKMLAIRSRIDSALNSNATFDEIVGAQKLTTVRTGPVFANGRDATNPAAAPDPRLGQVIAAGFAAAQGDAPQMVAIGNDGSFAIVAVDRVIAAAPAPLAEIRPRVAADITVDRARKAARKVAADVVAKANGGTPIAAALSATGLKLPPVKPMAASRAQLAAAQGRVPPPLALLFSMSAKSAKLLEAPDNAGWYVIHLETIERGDAHGNPAVVTAMRGEMARSLGNEYVAQFANAVRREIGVSKNDAAIAKLKAELGGVTQP